VSFATIDATDPDRVAAFWGEILGTAVEETSDEGRFVSLREASGHMLSSSSIWLDPGTGTSSRLTTRDGER
jgi:hypothetical protein